MLKKINIIIFLITGIITINLHAQSNELDSLINRAIEVSPKLKMLNAKIDAAESKIDQNSNLPDPMLTLGLMNMPVNTFSFSQEPMTGKVVGLSQKVPFPGKLSAMSDVDSKQVEIVQQEVNDAENEIVKDVKKNYYDLIFIRKSIQIANESKELLNKIAEVVRTGYEVNKASQQNLVKVELEITNLEEKIQELQGKENSTIANLNALLLRSPDTEIPADDLPEINYLNLNPLQLDSLAKDNRPYLTGIKLAEDKAKLQESLADYNYYPDFNFSVQYSQRDEIARTNTPLTDFFSVMVGISLPLNYGGKVDAKVEEAVSMQQFYSEQYEMAVQILQNKFGSIKANLEALKDRIELTNQGMLPQAEQNMSSALSGYQVGNIDFINVIDAQNKLFQIETSLYKLKTNYLKDIADLEFLTGTELK